MTTNLSERARRYLARYQQIYEALVEGMTSPKLTQSISHNFIVQMIPHHRAAIEMSRNVLKYTINRPLRRIAEGIITEQTQSIADMQAILSTCADQRNTTQEVEAYQAKTEQIMREMFEGMRTTPRINRIDVDFMREMIPHHEGAIRMSENALQYPICPGLIPILNAIIESQEKGVRQMNALLQQSESRP